MDLKWFKCKKRVFCEGLISFSRKRAHLSHFKTLGCFYLIFGEVLALKGGKPGLGSLFFSRFFSLFSFFFSSLPVTNFSGELSDQAPISSFSSSKSPPLYINLLYFSSASNPRAQLLRLYDSRNRNFLIFASLRSNSVPGASL